MSAEKSHWVKAVGVTMTLLGAVATYHLLFVGARIVGRPLILGGPILLTLGLLLLWRRRPRPSNAKPGVRLLVRGFVMLALSLVLVNLATLARSNELLGIMATGSQIFLAAPGLLMVIVGISRVVGSRPPSQP